MTTIYGIPNCDTMKKARRWLDEHGVAYHFHDYRKDGLSREQLTTWVTELGWENVLNKRGTTWRKLPDTVKENIDQASAISVMLEQPAMIKRPLLEHAGEYLLGFNADTYAQTFTSETT